MLLSSVRIRSSFCGRENELSPGQEGSLHEGEQEKPRVGHALRHHATGFSERRGGPERRGVGPRPAFSHPRLVRKWIGGKRGLHTYRRVPDTAQSPK